MSHPTPLTKAVFWELCDQPLESKTEFENAVTPIAITQRQWNNIPHITLPPRTSSFNQLPNDTPIMFIAHRGEQSFLVKTKGFDYCRHLSLCVLSE